MPTPESRMKSSPDTEEILEFTEEEVERAITRMKRHKAQGMDGITSDIIKLGGGGGGGGGGEGAVVLTYLSNIFNNILKTKQITTVTKYSQDLQTRIEITLGENQEKKQVSEKGFSTTDHLQALNQITEKSNEYNLPLCIGFIDYGNAFGTVEHFAIFEALRITKINERYINILQKIYIQATARIYLDK